MLHQGTQQLVISESVAGSSTTIRDIVIQGDSVQIAVVMPSRTSGSLTVTVHPLVGDTYQGDAIITLGPLSSASSTPVLSTAPLSWGHLRVIATYTGTLTYHIHAHAATGVSVVGLTSGTEVGLAAGATVELAPGTTITNQEDLSTRSVISTDNVYNSTLTTGNTYTGTWEDVTNYPDIGTLVHTTQTITQYIDFSMDGSTVHRTLTFTISANGAIPHKLARIAQYYRVRLANDSGSTATIRLQTILGAYSKSALTTNLSTSLTSSADAEMTRTVLVGETDGGQFINVPVTGEGHIEMEVHGPRLPFSSIHAERLRPVFQITGVYGANPLEISSGATLSGTATAGSGLLTVSTGTSVGATAYQQSRRRLRYRPGQGSVMRFTAMYTTPVANSYQVAGMGHGEDGYFFAYRGTEFGILHNYRGVREVQTLTLSVASSTNENVTVQLNGVDTSVAVTNSGNINRTAYEISQGAYAGWTAEAVGSTVIFLANDVGNKTLTFSLTGTTAAGTFAETKQGSAASETFIAQSSWNQDKMDGTGYSGVTLDPTKLNVYQIGMAYLGAGAVTFQIMLSPGNNNPTWETVHIINNPNTLTLPHVGNPSFPFTMAVYSAGSTTNLTVSSASCAGFVEGDRIPTGPRLAYQAASTSVTAANYHALLTIRNSRYYNSRSNQSIINILSFAAAVKHTQPVTIYLLRNATLAGNVNFSSYATGSCAYLDTAATTCTLTSNNQIIWSSTLAETGNLDFVLTDDISLQPGETITLAAKSVAGSPAYVLGSVTTREDQ